MDRDQLVRQFRVEAEEHLLQVERSLVALEREPGEQRHIHAIFQAVHGIKGTSDYLDLTSISRLSHEMETLLNRIRKGAVVASPEIIDEVLRGVDLLKDLIAHTETPAHRAEEVAEYAQRIVALSARRSRPPPGPALRRTGGPDKSELQRAFNDAARQHVEALRLACDDLSAGENAEAATRILRRTLKTFRNSASYLGLTAFVETLDALREELAEASELGPQQLASLTGSVELLEQMVEELSGGVSSSGQEATAVGGASAEGLAHDDSGAAGTAGDETLRVSMKRLDQFMNLVSELVLARNAINHLNELARIEEVSPEFARLLQSSAVQLNKTTDRLQDQLMSVRMVPIGRLFERFPRIVRDLARSQGKEARLSALGGDTEVDKGVVDLLAEPLMHLIRNAIAHGIETAEERRAASKAATGTITLKAEHQGGAITVEVLDDGRGIDVDGIRAKAIADGLVTAEEVRQMSERELVDLVFRPGFSTASETDSLSGRGVGLDVVGTNIKRIGGNVQVDWEKGSGARFRIKIPLTLAVVQTLVVEAGSQRFAVPTTFIEENLQVPRDRVTRINNVRTVIHKDEPLPLLPLDTLLGIEHEDDGRPQLTALLLHLGTARFGLLVDRIVAQQDALIRPLDSELGKLSQYSGATVMSDGNLVLILNPPGLVGAARRVEAAS